MPHPTGVTTMFRKTLRNPTSTLLGIALVGMTLSGSALAVQPLAKGASHATAEGKCGEGKCGDATFARIDTSHDGRISRKEFEAEAPGQDALFARKDTNHDGYIDEKESYYSIKSIYESHGRALPSGLFAHPPRK